jgi:glutathione S-transferase
MQTQLTLFHHPFCPHSRFVRFVLREYGLPVRQVGERVWERREEFLAMNPAGTTPVLVIEGQPPVPGAALIVEYLDEVYGTGLGDSRLLPQTVDQRIEVRRLMHWFNEKFFEEVSGPVTAERYKRHMPLDAGGGAADYAALDAARQNIVYHLSYLDLLLRDRNWLGGAGLTYADLAAAAHLSTTDYLGAIPWSEGGAAKAWYARLQSRPAFQSVLADGWRGFVRP